MGSAGRSVPAHCRGAGLRGGGGGGWLPWIVFRVAVRGPGGGCAFSSSFCEDDEGAASGQQLLQKFRGGVAERGEDWLRKELDRHRFRELHRVAAAADVPRDEGGAHRSKEQLVDALCQRIAEEQASGRKGGIVAVDHVSCRSSRGGLCYRFCEDDEGAASGQQLLQKFRGGFRQKLDKHSIRELHRVAAAAGVPRDEGGAHRSKQQLVDALCQRIQASGGIVAVDRVSRRSQSGVGYLVEFL